MNNLFYCDDEEEFYNVQFLKNSIVIEHICENNFGDELNQNVQWISQLPFKIKTNKPDKYCLQYFDDKEILLYPFQSGIPFFLRIATKDDIDYHIKDCGRWHVSSQFYDELLPSIAQQLPDSELESSPSKPLER
jgi:hypothetical protein